MGSLIGVLLVLSIICGVIRGLTDDRPSFWRGFGEGMAGHGRLRGDTFLFFHDRRTGLGMGTRLDDD